MTIQEKPGMNFDQMMEHGTINIVAFGDSVTHGAMGSDEINYETVCRNRLRRKITALRNYVPVNAINAGIGGHFRRVGAATDFAGRKSAAAAE